MSIPKMPTFTTGCYVSKIERDYVDMQETLLSAGMSGLNLAVVFHEVERGVRMLHQAIVESKDLEGAARQARELMRVLDGFSTLLRRDSKRWHSARTLVGRARQFNLSRFRHHRIEFNSSLLDGADADFESNFQFGLVLGALNNLIDNSLYWLRVRWPNPADEAESVRRLSVNAFNDLPDGPTIVVADNGVGLQDTPDHVVRPFFTRKPDGMGLGLYYANLAMELNGGRLAFPQRGEVDVPEECDGAVVAMIFNKTGK